MEFKNLIKKVSLKKDLTIEEASFVAKLIMEKGASQIQVAALLALLAAKGESVSEITGFAKVMREKSEKIDHPSGLRVIDTCGTGGDSKHTINVSTLSAIIAAGAGITVAKHGNRSVSSKCGCADLLEGLGVDITISPKQVSGILKEIGFSFLFAQKLHLAMKNVAPIRREMGIRTIFNILGPLTNPANAKAQVIGVFKKDLVLLMANVLKELNSEEAIVLYSEDGMDEISISAPTYYAHLKDGQIKESCINPEEIIDQTYVLDEVIGGDIETNVRIAKDLLQGKIQGAKKEIVLLNAAAAVIVAGKAIDFSRGYNIAKESLESGKAWKLIESYIKATKI